MKIENNKFLILMKSQEICIGFNFISERIYRQVLELL